MKKITLFWFRRDLRLHDNVGLFNALKITKNVLPLFIFDTDILNKIENKQDQRVAFIYSVLESIQNELISMGTSLLVRYGKPMEVFKELITEFSIDSVFVNHDYESYSIKRDLEIQEFCKSNQIPFFTFKDQVIFDHNEIIKDDGLPYKVFTPYSRKWKSKLLPETIKVCTTELYFHNFFTVKPFPFLAIKEIGFQFCKIDFVAPVLKETLLLHYKENRDFPSIEGTSRLGLHLRFGTISIRSLVKKALELSETFLNELIWREFYKMILFHFPFVENRAFKKQYDFIPWRNNEYEFECWCKGITGYPIVDAGMRELNATGFMHNRVRMITAGFLTKHLLIDWRWGETYFAEKLLDFDLSSNNGGWQWASGSGCDAVPYFRIFNPIEQTRKFDSDFNYIRKWVPEFREDSYAKPIVEHIFARNRALQLYKTTLIRS